MVSMYFPETFAELLWLTHLSYNIVDMNLISSNFDRWIWSFEIFGVEQQKMIFIRFFCLLLLQKIIYFNIPSWVARFLLLFFRLLLVYIFIKVNDHVFLPWLLLVWNDGCIWFHFFPFRHLFLLVFGRYWIFSGTCFFFCFNCWLFNWFIFFSFRFFDFIVVLFIDGFWVDLAKRLPKILSIIFADSFFFVTHWWYFLKLSREYSFINWIISSKDIILSWRQILARWSMS